MNERFLNLFGDIESELKVRLRLPPRDRTMLATLIRNYLQRNPYWQDDAADLDHLREIRNFLTHERNTDRGYPVAVTEEAVTLLEVILERLNHPRTIGERFSRPVVTVKPGDQISAVLRLAYKLNFSQFPVVENGRFLKVLTENELIRRLGWHLSQGYTTQIDLDEWTVAMALQEEIEDRQLFRFVRTDASEEETMGMFQQPELEVVLLTENGQGNMPLQGIITQWDAARYPGV